MLQGQLKETLFDWPEKKLHGDMVQKSQRVLQENKVAYINGEKQVWSLLLSFWITPPQHRLSCLINEPVAFLRYTINVCHSYSFLCALVLTLDSIGLHRMENGSHTECAASLHLYSPPFQTCQTFDQRTGHKNTVKMTFWSKYGKRTPFVRLFYDDYKKKKSWYCNNTLKEVHTSHKFPY